LNCNSRTHSGHSQTGWVSGKIAEQSISTPPTTAVQFKQLPILHSPVGASDGAADGSGDGSGEGAGVGDAEGEGVGPSVGPGDGAGVGPGEGAGVGPGDGAALGKESTSSMKADQKASSAPAAIAIPCRARVAIKDHFIFSIFYSTH